MKVKDLDIPNDIMAHLNSCGIETLYPPQKMAVEAGLMEGKSILVSAPTASGKSLIALLAILSMLKRGGRKAVYLSPLKALAAEKYQEFKDTPNPIRPSISIGDLNVRSRLLGNVLCMTNERMDLALRRDESWVDSVDLIITDEIHLVGNTYRGPVLEMVLTRLRENRQIVGLSATISNAKEIAKWLNCTLVRSDWRPVRLIEGVFHEGIVRWSNNKETEIKTSSRGSVIDLALDSIRGGHQSLVFVNTRRGAPSQASKAAVAVRKTLNDADREILNRVSDAILRGNEDTELIVQLSRLVKDGVAFHHAGLNSTCRDIIERHFRSGHIKVLTATPTLAAGVNLPARRVIISNITRYNMDYGRNMPISVMEYKQFCGRAGRPQYDDIGEAVVVTKHDPYDILDTYIHGEPEPIHSQIYGQLDIHLLSLIVSRPGITLQQINDFFDGTFGGMSGSIMADHDLDGLHKLKMIDTLDGNRYAATKLGELTSRLYIKPHTASDFLRTIKKSHKKRKNTLGFLYAISESDEFFPKMAQLSDQYSAAHTFLEMHQSEMIKEIYSFDISRSLLGLYGWINEETEKEIAERYKLESGDIHRATEMSRWLLKCMSDLARYAKSYNAQSELESLRIRVINGVRDELVPLVQVKNVGRVRARALYTAGVRNVPDIKDMPLENIQKICKVGLRVAKSIKAGR